MFLVILGYYEVLNTSSKLHTGLESLWFLYRRTLYNAIKPKYKRVSIRSAQK